MNNVKRVGYTQWDEDYEHKSDNPEDIISYCARVSNPSNQDNYDTSEKLLKYCVRKKHWSVFTMVNFVFEINTPRDISRQILRHSSLKPQEFSQRYANISEMGRCIREPGFQDEKNRQNSIPFDLKNPHHVNIRKEFLCAQQEVWDKAIHEYNKMIEFGIAKEDARVLMPEGLTMSRLFLNGTVRDWFHYCQVRMDNDTQKEHIVIANEVWELLTEKMTFLKTIDVEIVDEK